MAVEIVEYGEQYRHERKSYMDAISMLALVQAGHITEDDNVLGLIQGLSLDQARGIADWLALATRGPVSLQYMSFSGTKYINIGHDDPTTKD
jgi:hypothetical protein